MSFEDELFKNVEKEKYNDCKKEVKPLLDLFEIITEAEYESKGILEYIPETNETELSIDYYQLRGKIIEAKETIIESPSGLFNGKIEWLKKLNELDGIASKLEKAKGKERIEDIVELHEKLEKLGLKDKALKEFGGCLFTR